MQTRSDDAVEIHAVVSEETMIFRRHDGANHGIPKVMMSHEAPLAARLIKKRGNDLRLKVVAWKGFGAGQRGDRNDVPFGELQGRVTLFEVVALEQGRGPRTNLQTVAQEPISADVRPTLVLGVQTSAKTGGNILRRNCLADK